MELVQACILQQVSRPDLDGNKLPKGMCLARKARDRGVYLIVPRVVNYSVFLIFKFKSTSKGLMHNATTTTCSQKIDYTL